MTDTTFDITARAAATFEREADQIKTGKGYFHAFFSGVAMADAMRSGMSLDEAGRAYLAAIMPQVMPADKLAKARAKDGSLKTGKAPSTFRDAVSIAKAIRADKDSAGESSNGAYRAALDDIWAKRSNGSPRKGAAVFAAEMAGTFDSYREFKAHWIGAKPTPEKAVLDRIADTLDKALEAGVTLPESEVIGPEGGRASAGLRTIAAQIGQAIAAHVSMEEGDDFEDVAREALGGIIDVMVNQVVKTGTATIRAERAARERAALEAEMIATFGDPVGNPGAVVEILEARKEA